MVIVNGTNYQKWKGKIRVYPYVKNLHLPMFATNKPKQKSDEE